MGRRLLLLLLPQPRRRLRRPRRPLPYSDAELAQAVPAAAFEAYVRARMELVREEAEREGEEWQRAELARLQALDEAREREGEREREREREREEGERERERVSE